MWFVQFSVVVNLPNGGSITYGTYSDKSKATEVKNELAFLYSNNSVEIKESWDDENE